MDFAKEFEEAIAHLRKAQKLHPGGDELDPTRLGTELADIVDAVGLLDSGDPFEEYFLEFQEKSPRAARRTRRPLPSYTSPPITNRDQRAKPKPAPKTSAKVVKFLHKIANSKKPLHSQYCRDAAKAYINQALRLYEARWLRKKGLGSDLPVVALRRKRLKSEEHERIRILIRDRVIPTVEAMATRDANAAKPWKQTVVLELAELFARYAPPKDYETLGIAALPGGEMTLFIQFVAATLEPFVVEKEAQTDSLSKYWIERKRVMLGART